jgi:hypothetical protein
MVLVEMWPAETLQAGQGQTEHQSTVHYCIVVTENNL